MSVRDNLPTGSSRNKIEYLADCIDNTGSAPDNLLLNPDFTLTTPDLKRLSNLTNMINFKSQALTQMYANRSFGQVAIPYWNIEVVADSVSNSFVEFSHDCESGANDSIHYKAKSTVDVMSGYDVRVMLYSVFTAPHEAENGHYFGNEYWSENKSHSVFLHGINQSMTSGRFGIAKLDDITGEFESIVAQAPFDETWDKPKRHWIHGIKLEPAKLYAFFVETQRGRSGYHCLETGVFLNPTETDIVPSLKPVRESRLRSFVNVGTYTKDAIAAGVDIPVSQFDTPLGVEKQLVFYGIASTSNGSKYLVKDPLSVTANDYQSVKVQGAIASQYITEIELMVHHSETPLYLNYFNSPNYAAL